jgi:predicted acetyltransferase
VLRAPASDRTRVRLVRPDEALAVVPGIHERVRAATPGMHRRSRAWWEVRTLSDRPDERDGAGPLFRAVLEIDGRPSGYALYRTRGHGDHRAELVVTEQASTSPLAERELWRYLAGVDLVERISAPTLRCDHVLPLLLEDPRAARLEIRDDLWVRVVDLPGALAARGYAADGELTIDVLDAFIPANGGCWRIECAGGEASVARAQQAPDLRLGIDDLASAYLGGFTFAELARALRVEELAPGAIARADALFAHDPAPWCPEIF